MRKILKFLMSFIMFFSVFSGISLIETEAKEYSFGCDAYELAFVNDEGGFDTVGCYSSFEEAKAAMSDDDHVVRHSSSKSPTKIIAIKSGIAISYPRRNGSTTLNVFQHADHITESGKYKSTYVTQHRELYQPETLSYDGNGEGNVKLVLQGFEGYAALSGMDLVPMKFIEQGLTITLGGQTNDSGVPEDPFEMIPHMGHYSVVQNGNYKDLVYTYYSGYDGSAYSLTIGQAADWMAAGHVYYSSDGYNFYADKKMEDYLATYYSYYVFLPLRSRSNVSGSVLDAYLASKGYTEKPTSTSVNDLGRNQSQMVNEGQTFVDSQNTYGVNTLLTYAMACNESGYGRSNYAVSKNNLFGWAAVDSNPDNAMQFASISSGIQEQMAYNLRGYLDIFDVRYFGMHLGNKESGFNVKYASDPYWGYKIAAIAYDIDKFSKNYDGTLSDYNVYSLGLINEFKTSYYRTASSSSEVMFTSEYSSQYQKNHIVIVKGETNDFYQVQSPNAILADGSILKHKVNQEVQPAALYDFERSVGFILSDHVTMLNEYEDVTIPGQTPEGDFMYQMDEFALSSEGILSLSGTAYLPGIYITESNQIVHTLKVYDEFYEEKAESRMVTVLRENSKDAADFNGTLDISILDDGKYYFRFNSDYSSFEEYCDTRVVSFNAQSIETDTKKYTFELKDSTLWLIVETKEVTELNPEDYTMISSMKTISFEDNILNLKGISLIRKLNHSEGEVKHELIAVNLDTNKEINCGIIKSSIGDYNLNELYDDGFDYSYGWYDDSIDLSALPKGDYALKVRTTVSGVSKDSKLYGSSKLSESLPVKGDDGLYRQLVMRYALSYRVEISVTQYVLNKEQKNKLPRIREGYQNLIAMIYNETDQSIVVSGSSFIWNVNFDETSEVQYTLHALNKSDGTVYEFSTFGSDLLMGEPAPWDNTLRVGSEYNYDFSWYDITMPISEMTDGEYEFVLQVETTDYVEYIDLKKSSTAGLKGTDSDSTTLVELNINRGNKNRVIMNLKRSVTDSDVLDE